MMQNERSELATGSRLTGKKALITGGASGIGRATALLLAQEGAAVVIVDIDGEQGQAVVQEITASGGVAFFIRCDVTQAVDCQRVVQATIEQFGGVDILI